VVAAAAALALAVAPAPSEATALNRRAARARLARSATTTAGQRVACTENPFTAGFAADIAARWPANRFTAALYDSRTRCEYTFRPEQRLATASVLKAEILAGIVLRAQREGRGLTAWEHAQAVPMIRDSANPEASALWRSLGGIPGMAALDRTLGLSATTPASPWGATLTTASDRNMVLRRMIWGEGGLFSGPYRMKARAYMLNVSRAQRWGIPTGVPSTWRVPLKNGFVRSSCCRWRINTSGVVERPGRGAYALTVLSDGWPNDTAGIAAVNYISGIVADWAAAPAGPHPSAARAVHRSYLDVLGRSATFAEERRGSDRVGTLGTGGPGMITALIQSPELDRVAGVMLRLYLGGLGVMPSKEAYARRAWQLRTGRLSPAQLGDEIVASLAFAGGADLSDPDFVDLVVQRTLGRTPSEEARDRWVALLEAGMSRGQVLLQFADSAESRWVRWAPVKVGAIWASMLRRPPGEPDLDLWTARLASGTPVESVVAMVFRSAEYARRW
jgi:hypothetical protein